MTERVSIWEMVFEYLQDMGMLWPDRYTPFYVASIGCHIANLYNRRQIKGAVIFHTEGGTVPDLRLHILMVCPSGFGKSYTPKRFISSNGKIGFLDLSGIAAVLRGYMTEAGLVGTFADGKEVRGLAYTHRDAIICLNELDAIQGEGEGSSKLDNALLDFLDDGWVHKTLSGGSIDYQSFASLWAGTQHSRFKMASGQPRRWIIIELLPSKEERRALKLAKRETRGLRPDMTRLNQIRKAIKALKEGFAVKEIRWGSELYELFDALDPDMSHNDEELYSRLAVGYNLMRYYKPGDKVLDIVVDEALVDMIHKAKLWRESILGDSTGAQVLQLVKEQPGITMSQLKREARAFSLTYRETAEILKDLEQHQAVIKQHKSTGGRPVTLYYPNMEEM